MPVPVPVPMPPIPSPRRPAHPAPTLRRGPRSRLPAYNEKTGVFVQTYVGIGVRLSQKKEKKRESYHQTIGHPKNYGLPRVSCEPIGVYLNDR